MLFACGFARRWSRVRNLNPHWRRGSEKFMQGGSNRLLTPAEVADWLKVSEVTVKNRYRNWGLRAQKVGRLLRFRERDIVAYLDSRYD
ncbi:helix-turn-helix domain-containing protein [Streptomyces sp. NPDC020096]